MASAEEYARWIVANEAKRGTPEFDTVARAYQLARQSQASTPKPSEPTPDPSEGGLPFRPFGIDTGLEMPQGVSRFAAGAGKAFTDIAHGAGQLTGQVSPEDVAASRELDQPLMNTGAGTTGNIAGNVAALLPSAFIPGVNTFAGSAALGAVAGALQPTVASGERMQNIGAGAVLSPATLGAGRLMMNTARGIGAGIAPMTERGQEKILGSLLRNTSGKHADNVIQNLQTAKELVPGSIPTAAQVSKSGGIAALERAAAQANPEQYATRQIEQNLARIRALRTIAGDDAALAKAKGARTALSDPLYKAAREEGIDPTRARMMRPQVENLLSRIPPEVIKKARNIARIEGESFNNLGSVKGMHYVKKAVDDMLDASGDTGVGKITKKALSTFKRDLLSTLDELSPKYAAARKAFAGASPEINQMEIGQALVNRLEPALTQGNIPVRMNAETFARALREGDVLARKATGFEGATLSGTMTPEQMALLSNIKDDLARSAIASNLGRGVGSNTFQNLAQENLMQSIGVSNLPQLLSRPVQMTNYGLRAIYGSANNEMKNKLAEALLNPQETARLMQSAIPTPQMQALSRSLRGAERYLPAAGALPVMGAQ